MREEYPSLNLAQIHAAISYAYENPAEIEAAYAEDRGVGERIERDHEAFLRRRSGG